MLHSWHFISVEWVFPLQCSQLVFSSAAWVAALGERGLGGIGGVGGAGALNVAVAAAAAASAAIAADSAIAAATSGRSRSLRFAPQVAQ